MCASCGCGDHNTRHKAGDIVLDDLKKAAKNSEIKVEEVVENLQEAVKGAK